MSRAVLAFIATLCLAPAAAAVECYRHADVLAHLQTQFGETAVANAVTETGWLVEVMATPNGSTWTMIVTRGDGWTCYIGNGEAWQVLVTKHPDF